MTSLGQGPNVSDTQISSYVRVKLAIARNFHFQGGGPRSPPCPLNGLFWLFWSFSQATGVQIQNGGYRCVQHLEPQVLNTHMPYFREILFSSPFLDQKSGPKQKFLRSIACGYSKLESRDAERNGTFRFQFGPL